jgi:hypothetical protein
MVDECNEKREPSELLSKIYKKGDLVMEEKNLLFLEYL